MTRLIGRNLQSVTQGAVKTRLNKMRYLIILSSFLTLFSSCGAGRPDFVGEWKSVDGVKITIKNITGEKYDVRIYLQNTDVPNSFISGMYSYNAKEKELVKMAFPETPMTRKSVFAITYAKGRLYIGGNYGGAFFIRQ
jgi:hypothetical protein